MKLCEREIKGILLDITGVLYESGDGFGTAISESAEAVKRIQNHKIPFRLVTNESSSGTEKLIAKLKHHSIDIEPSQIFSPIPAVKSILKAKNLKPYLVVHDQVTSEFEDVEQDNPNCVVLGDADKGLSFENMNRAFNVLMAAQEPILFSLGKGKYYRHKGELLLDAGPFTKALEYACDIQAQIIGKPSPEYFSAALDDMNLTPNEAVMIGDDIVSDVGGAQSCGMAGILVKTGKYTQANLNHPIVKPDFIADNLFHAITHLLQSS